MELKSYQKEVIADLARYLELVVELQSPAKAYQVVVERERTFMVGLRRYAGLCERTFPVCPMCVPRCPPAAARPLLPPVP